VVNTVPLYLFIVYAISLVPYSSIYAVLSYYLGV